MREELAAFMEGLKRFLSAAADLIVLNILVFLCCIPVVTAGAAWVAGYAYILRILRGVETGFPFKPFWEDFKRNFRKSTGVWLLLLLCLLILAGDYYFAVYLSEPTNKFFLVFSIVMAIILLFAATWLFPLMARYENTVRGHIKNSFLMALATFPKTLLAMALQVAVIALPLLIPDLFVVIGWLWILFGISLPMYLIALIFRKPLDSEPQKVEDMEQD